MVGQLHVPEAGQLVNQERVLFDHSIEDVLQTDRQTDTHTQPYALPYVSSCKSLLMQSKLTLLRLFEEHTELENVFLCLLWDLN